MDSHSKEQIADQIIEKAKSLGADLVGIASVADLKTAPAFTFAPKMPFWDGVGSRDNKLGLKPGEVAWPDGARCAVVIAVEHPEEKPELDWWFGRKNPPGNRILMDVVKTLCKWIPESFGIGTFHFPYHVEQGGIYLKDAAVLAGLGCIGKNNMLVTPEYGPRIRLRAFTLDTDVPSSGPADYDPCESCDEPCRQACPQGAFNEQLYTVADYDQEELPGRTGVFSRPTCNIQMTLDLDEAQEEVVEGFDVPIKLIKYCRRCEMACPAGA